MNRLYLNWLATKSHSQKQPKNRAQPHIQMIGCRLTRFLGLRPGATMYLNCKRLLTANAAIRT